MGFIIKIADFKPLPTYFDIVLVSATHSAPTIDLTQNAYLPLDSAPVAGLLDSPQSLAYPAPCRVPHGSR